MLITNQSHEITDGLYLLGPETRLWRSVNLDLEMPCFLVTYEIQEQFSRVRQSAILWRLSDLVGMCEQINDEIAQELIHVSLLSPSWMNGSDSWQTNSLQEIWSAEDLEEDSVFSYVIEAGRRYFSPSISGTEEQWEHRDMLFSFAQYSTEN